MNKINIGNAPAYTSPNSMTLICTEKPDGSTNLALNCKVKRNSSNET